MRICVALICLFALTANAADAPVALRGYTSADAAKEVEWETKFRGLPEPEKIRGRIMWARRTTRTTRSGW
jgi:hypothetical protein